MYLVDAGVRYQIRPCPSSPINRMLSYVCMVRHSMRFGTADAFVMHIVTVAGLSVGEG